MIPFLPRSNHISFYQTICFISITAAFAHFPWLHATLHQFPVDTCYVAWPPCFFFSLHATSYLPHAISWWYMPHCTSLVQSSRLPCHVAPHHVNLRWHTPVWPTGHVFCSADTKKALTSTRIPPALTVPRTAPASSKKPGGWQISGSI